MLEGDATKEDYGLSPENKNVLMDVNIIFHVAAIVRFNEKLRTAVNVNVKSTKFLLSFAKKLPNLKVYLIFYTKYVSLIYEAHELLLIIINYYICRLLYTYQLRFHIV